MTDTNEIEVKQFPIELYKVLKFSGLVASGAEAKHAIANGLVQVNNQTEIRKRRKLVKNDIISFLNQPLKVI